MAENDANATAHGEWHFVPEHRSGGQHAMGHAIGVGCGLVADGRVLRGAHGLAGASSAHMIVDVAGDGGTVWEAARACRSWEMENARRPLTGQPGSRTGWLPLPMPTTREPSLLPAS